MIRGVARGSAQDMPLAAVDQAQLYREIIEPTEAALNEKYERRSFDRIGKPYKIPRYARGFFH